MDTVVRLSDLWWQLSPNTIRRRSFCRRVRSELTSVRTKIPPREWTRQSNSRIGRKVFWMSKLYLIELAAPLFNVYPTKRSMTQPRMQTCKPNGIPPPFLFRSRLNFIKIGPMMTKMMTPVSIMLNYNLLKNLIWLEKWSHVSGLRLWFPSGWVNKTLIGDRMNE